MDNISIIQFFLKHNFLINPDLIDFLKINNLIVEDYIPLFDFFYEKEKGVLVLSKNLFEYYMKTYNLALKNTEIQISQAKEEIKKDFSVEIIKNYEEKDVKISVLDFVLLYNKRFFSLQKIIRLRKEMELAVSINRLYSMEDKEKVSIIGLIKEIIFTKNKYIILTLEDLTGEINVILTNSKETEGISELTLDEVIGVTGVLSIKKENRDNSTKKSNIAIFGNSIFFPDIPNGEIKKSPIKEAAVFISDVHIGSKAFLKKEFEKFIEWLNGNYVDSEKTKEMSNKVKYLFIVGDLVEGIGIYPEQEKDLEVKDIFMQYKIFSDYLKKIPKHINIIISPGNHDTLRIAEPQPPIPKELLPDLYNEKNIFFVSNPSIVRIGKKNNFSGFDVLIYHGFSFPYYADSIESLRFNGGLEKTENIMSFLLKKRHLAPTHGSTQYQLGYDDDPMLIKNIPDFFVTGHVHRASIKTYKNITLLNCSCWISQTDYQEKRGLVPMPAKAIYVNLNNREVKILDFLNY